MLHLSSLSVVRSGRPVLRDVTVDFTPGITAVLGQNGAGKTTLLRAALGLIDLSSGRVCFEGEDIRTSKQTRRRLHAALGWVPQEAGFPRGVSVREAVEYADWLKSGAPGGRRQRWTAALDATNLADLSQRQAHRLSGGERRRLALACAIVAQPRVLVLDEPTSGLDPLQRHHFLDAVTRLPGDPCVILSTHLVEDILHVAQRLIALNRGRVVFDGTIGAVIPPSGSAADAARAMNRLLTEKGPTL